MLLKGFKKIEGKYTIFLDSDLEYEVKMFLRCIMSL